MPRKPNLIYVFADQLRYQSLGYTGDKKAKTPNIDKLAAQSVELCNTVSGHPVCAPYRASLFTGKYTTSTGMVINEIRLGTNHKCFAHVLNDNGYDTSYIGKWHMYADQVGNHYDPKNSFIPKGPNRLGFDGFFAAYNFHHNYYGAAAYYHLDTSEKVYCDGYEPDIQTDIAISRLRAHAKEDKPFALFLSYGTPHDPWEPENVPGEYLERFKDTDFSLPGNYLPDNDPFADKWARLDGEERESLTEWMRVYYAMTANLDDNIGRLMDEIKALGLEDDSIIVFTSDHGEMFGAHGRRAKNIFYEESVHVPFLVSWKGRTANGSNCDICLNTVDIMPTLLSMMELPIPGTVEGGDFSRAVLGIPDAKKPEGSLMMGTGATAKFEDGHEWRAWRNERYTYAVYRADGSELLFDNVNDPLQVRNLAKEEAYVGVLSELKALMHNEMKRIGDSFESCSFYEKNAVKNRVIMI